MHFSDVSEGVKTGEVEHGIGTNFRRVSPRDSLAASFSPVSYAHICPVPRCQDCRHRWPAARAQLQREHGDDPLATVEARRDPGWHRDRRERQPSAKQCVSFLSVRSPLTSASPTPPPGRSASPTKTDHPRFPAPPLARLQTPCQLPRWKRQAALRLCCRVQSQRSQRSSLGCAAHRTRGRRCQGIHSARPRPPVALACRAQITPRSWREFSHGRGRCPRHLVYHRFPL